MDMHRMNKILEVNEKFAYAVVEPGVSFADLYDYTIKNKIKLWPSTASLGWGSIVGNVSIGANHFSFPPPPPPFWRRIPKGKTELC